MKWMNWSEDDLYAARPEIVVEMVRMMKEEQEELEKLRNKG